MTKISIVIILLLSPGLLLAQFAVSSGVPTVPSASPAGGTYTSVQSVTYTLPSGSYSCYTTDSSTPSVTLPSTCGGTGTHYTGAISVSASETLKAIDCLPYQGCSPISSDAYVINLTVANPTTSPGAGSYGSTQSVTFASTTSGATFCYRTDGTNPAATTPGTCDGGSTTYSGAISTSSTTTYKVLGTKSGLTNSSVQTFTYTITTALNFVTGGFVNAGATNVQTLSALACTAGDMLVLAGHNLSASLTLTPTTTSGNTLTQLVAPFTNMAGNETISVYIVSTCNGTTGDYVWTWSGGAFGWLMYAEYSKGALSGILDNAGTVTSGSNGGGWFDASATSVGSGLALGIIFSNNGSPMTNAPAGWTSRIAIASSPAALIQDNFPTSAGTITWSGNPATSYNALGADTSSFVITIK